MQELSELMAIQYGLLTREQARKFGLTDAMLRSRVRRGELSTADGVVFRVPGAPVTFHQRVLAACLGTRELCVASHRTAAVLHGFDGFSQGPIEVLLRHPARYRRSEVIVHSTRVLPNSDITRVGPIPVTTPIRTLIDLGAVAPFHLVEHATDGAVRDGVAAPRALVARHTALRARGRDGSATMRAILVDRERVRPHSVLERRFLRVLIAASLPEPVLQYRVALAPHRYVRLDAAYPDLMLGFELDGHRWHATRARRAADNRRAGALATVGWDVRRFTYHEVVDDPSYVSGAVRAAISVRSGDKS